MTSTTIGLSLAAICIASLGVMCWLYFRVANSPDYMGEPGHSDYDGDA